MYVTQRNVMSRLTVIAAIIFLIHVVTRVNIYVTINNYNDFCYADIPKLGSDQILYINDT